MPGRPHLLASALATTLALTACSGAGTAGAPGGEDAPAGRLSVTASFYPLEYLAQRVAGDHAEISTLTAPGIDPHDVELSPRAVGSLGTADLVVYASGMQPAVDQAVATQAADHGFDVTPAADLLPFEEDEVGDGGDHAVDDGHDHGPADPHFWLDPRRYGDVAVALADELSALDPDHADDYAAGAEALVADLQQLDRELEEGLARCESREVVTTHDAFGYLGARYDLHVTGITGISPDSEPSPARLADVTRLVEDLDVTTVYAEPLLSPAIAETVAAETGTQVLTLDPADGLSQATAGGGGDTHVDYLQIMRANLATLREGQGCS